MNAPQANALQGAIHKLAFREPLTADDAEAAFDIVMQGQATAVQVAALLSALRATGGCAAGCAAGVDPDPWLR